MFLILDTCALNHIRNLFKIKSVDLRPYLADYRVAITEKLTQEWKNYNLFQFFPESKCYHIPLEFAEFQQFSNQFPFFNHLDKADQSIVLSTTKDNCLVVSDDGELIDALLSLSKKVIDVPGLCLLLVQYNQIQRNLVYKALNFWEEVGLYSKKKLKNYHTRLRKLR